MPSDSSEEGLFAIAVDALPDEPTLRRANHPWPSPPRSPQGSPRNLAEFDEKVHRVLTGDLKASLIVVPPRDATDDKRPFRETPYFGLSLRPWTKVRMTPAPDEDKGVPEMPEVIVTSDVLAAAKMRYMLLSSGGGHPAADRSAWGRYLDACRRVRDVLQGPFAFGGPWDAFFEPGLVDPRSRAWGLTYYGPDLVALLGRERLASAPAASIGFDEAGGCWLQLAALPFVDAPELERRREAVERHLELARHFPAEDA